MTISSVDNVNAVDDQHRFDAKQVVNKIYMLQTVVKVG